MKFDDALKAATDGFRIRRKNWDDDVYWIWNGNTFLIPSYDGRLRDIREVPNLEPAIKDFLAEDWIVIKNSSTCKERASFGKAFEWMLAGHKVRRKGWEGYWFWNYEANTIMIQCRPWKGLEPFDIRKTDNPRYTFSNIAANDWEIVPEDSEDK